MNNLSTNCLVDDTKLVRKIMAMSNSSEGVRTCVEVKKMKIDKKNIARVLSGRITEVKFFPTKDTRMVAVGNNCGNVGFWNIDSDDEIYVYYPHSGIVSGISIHPYSLSKIITSCYDGFIRLLDVEKESFDLLYTSAYQVFSICRPHDNMNSLFIGESYGSVGSLDIRSSNPNSMSWDLHAEQIYTIDFNSQNTNLMATSSKDGTACIWDLRKLAHLDPQPLKLVRHKDAVNSAYFSPSGNLLATTSKDNNIGLISGANYEVESMIYHSNKTPRFISSFRGIWGWDDSFIMVGNMKKGVDVICVEEKKLAYTMADREINAIPCRFDAHPMLPGVLAISTAGGRVYVWDI
ncbi:WD repeat-containing protein 76 [Helianthus annuus]|nr:WD repeat-containing protein 76 [Helianthus annuus]